MLFRSGVCDYNLNLSRVAHREETLFTYELHKKGYGVYAVSNAVSWHLKNPNGGIRAETKRLREELESKGQPLAVYDVPLLFETKAQSQFDEIIVISCTADQQRERMQLRDSQLSAAEIGKRIAAQIPMPIKEAGADFVVRNDRDEAHLQSEIQRLLQWLEELKKN